MTLDEAIKQCDEAAEDRDKMSKRYDDASGYSRSHNEAIRTNDAKECEKCSQNFRQLAGWLRELKALKAEHCEDAISREAALLALTGVNLLSKKPEELISLFDRRIKALPSVTPKQKTGEILTDFAIFTDINGFERIVKKTTYCSLCKWDLGYNGDLLAHYCPNCGVKLEYKGR